MSDSPGPNNGTPGPRIKRREAWVDLPPEYEGFKVRVWLNAPASMWADVWSGDNDKIGAALKLILLEHNNWLDFDGNPYPPLSENAFYVVAPTELVSTMIKAAELEIKTLPNSLAPKRRK